MAARPEQLEEIGPVALDGFEVWDKRVQAPAGSGKRVAFVSVRTGRTVGLNVAPARCWVGVMRYGSSTTRSATGSASFRETRKRRTPTSSTTGTRYRSSAASCSSFRRRYLRDAALLRPGVGGRVLIANPDRRGA